MRKCLRCGCDMEEHYELLISSYFTNIGEIKIFDTNKKFNMKAPKPIKTAVCPQCGEISIYYPEITEKSE